LLFGPAHAGLPDPKQLRRRQRVEKLVGGGERLLKTGVDQ
jgi:hypothetical protein